MLAADVCLADAPIESGPAANLPADETNGSVRLSDVSMNPVFIGPQAPLPARLLFSSNSLLANDGDQVFAVRTHRQSSDTSEDHPKSTLYTFDRQDDGTLLESNSVNLNFFAKELVITEQALVIAGSVPTGTFTSNNGKTLLMVIPLEQSSQWSTLSIDGFFDSVVQKKDRLFVSTKTNFEFDPGSAIGPSPLDRYTVSVIEISDATATVVAVGKFQAPVTENMIVGDDLLIVEDYIQNAINHQLDLQRPATFFANGPRWGTSGLLDVASRLVRYRIAERTFETVAQLELSGEFGIQAEIATDGQTAVVFGQHTVESLAWSGADPIVGFSVSLIDLSSDQPVLFEVISNITSDHRIITVIGDQAVVLTDGRGGLIVVNTNQSTDADTLPRLKRVTLPERPAGELPQIRSLSEVSPGSFFIVRRLDTRDSRTGASIPSDRQEVLTLSTNDFVIPPNDTTAGSSITVRTNDFSAPKIIEQQRLWNERTPQSLIVGSLDDSGRFIEQSVIQLSGALDINATIHRLQLRHIDRIIEYSWDDLATPIQAPLGDLLPGPVAIDDAFRRNGESQERYLDVLGNDQLVEQIATDQARVVDLIDAPEGVVIASGGKKLRMSDDLMHTDGTFQFQYVFQHGASLATGTVQLTLFRYSDQDIAQAVSRAVDQAAEDLGVERTNIIVGSELRYTQRTMPNFVSEGITNPLGGRFGVFVDVVAGDTLYRYAADFEGQVARLNSRPFQKLMELRLKIVDSNGSPVESIQSGDQFFIEVIAKDIRKFGMGVMGVAFDLALPPDKIELTGQFLLLDGYSDFENNEFKDRGDEQGIDEFSAIDVGFDHPGHSDLPIALFGVHALAGGEVTLQLDAAESPDRELLIRGVDLALSSLEVNFKSTTLTIGSNAPTDTDANGTVTPIDALRVINFLSVYGNLSVDELPAIVSAGDDDNVLENLVVMRRLDTNADGQITARDALAVINEIARTLGLANLKSITDETISVDL